MRLTEICRYFNKPNTWLRKGYGLHKAIKTKYGIVRPYTIKRYEKLHANSIDLIANMLYEDTITTNEIGKVLYPGMEPATIRGYDFVCRAIYQSRKPYDFLRPQTFKKLIQLKDYILMNKIVDSVYTREYLKTLNKRELEKLRANVRENMSLSLDKKEANIAIISSMLGRSHDRILEEIKEAQADISDSQDNGSYYE